MFLSQFSRYLTLASEVVFLKMPSRNQKKRSKQRAEYLQKREDILSQENKAKARARYKADPEKKKASVRDTYNANAISKRTAKRQRYQEGVEENRAAKRQRYQEGTVLLIGGYTGAIQLPLRQLEGVGIGRVVELPLPPKGML